MSLTLYVSLIIFLCWCFKILNKIFRDFVLLIQIPGPPIKNLVEGNVPYLHTTRDNIFLLLRKFAKQYYPIYTFSFVYKFAVLIHTPEDAEIILSNPKHNRKGRLYNVLHGWLDTGLLTSTGTKWATRRKILTPAFHFTILQQFIVIFNEETDQLVATFKSLCHQPFITLNSHVKSFTLKTLAETSMGCKLSFKTKNEVDYENAITEFGKIAVFKIVNPWFIDKVLNVFRIGYYHEYKTIKTLHKFSKEVIEKREEKIKEVELPNELNYRRKRRLAMLDLMLMAKNQDHSIDDKGIQEEVDTFMFEGHDTTASAVCFSLLLLACHKDVQDRIIEEMNAVLGDLHKKPTYQDLQDMKYLERAIKEVLRICPSVPLITRRSTEDWITSSGYKIPKYTETIIQIYDIHHNPELYPDPEKFDPDRFLPENSANRHPFAFLPFSAGPRNCIGQKFAMLELKAVICGVLASFVLEPVDTPETVVYVVDMILKTKEPLKVRFVPRQ